MPNFLNQETKKKFRNHVISELLYGKQHPFRSPDLKSLEISRAFAFLQVKAAQSQRSEWNQNRCLPSGIFIIVYFTLLCKKNAYFLYSDAQRKSTLLFSPYFKYLVRVLCAMYPKSTKRRILNCGAFLMPLWGDVLQSTKSFCTIWGS